VDTSPLRRGDGFREGAVRLVRETGKPIAQVARDLGINEGTPGNWVNLDKRRRGDGTGELQGQRQAVQPGAQLDDRRRVVAGQLEVGLDVRVGWS